ncbi:MAG: cell division topological specificity factor MinE [Frisingicoccus sp.]
MGWFFGLRRKKKKGSGAVAKQRLKTLLISDRADCSADLINGIKGDIGLTFKIHGSGCGAYGGQHLRVKGRS